MLNLQQLPEVQLRPRTAEVLSGNSHLQGHRGRTFVDCMAHRQTASDRPGCPTQSEINLTIPSHAGTLEQMPGTHSLQKI